MSKPADTEEASVFPAWTGPSPFVILGGAWYPCVVSRVLCPQRGA
jgi:hypothetical protein